MIVLLHVTTIFHHVLVASVDVHLNENPSTLISHFCMNLLTLRNGVISSVQAKWISRDSVCDSTSRWIGQLRWLTTGKFPTDIGAGAGSN